MAESKIKAKRDQAKPIPKFKEKRIPWTIHQAPEQINSLF